MEVKVALDTNRLSDLFRGDRELAAFLEGCDEVWIPLFVIGEIRAAFQGGNQPGSNELGLRKLLSKSTFNILLPSIETSEHYGRLSAQLRRAGTPIPTNDLWIAALALEHNLTLITRAGHFEHIPQLSRR